MPAYRATYRIDRTPHQVFDVAGTNVYANHPRWESEVVEIRPITPLPVRAGSRAVMVREERGKRSETTYEVTTFEPDRAIAFRHDHPAMTFALRFELAPAGPSATDLTVDVRVELKGAFRLATPLFALQLPRRSDRIARQMVVLVEGRGPVQPVMSSPIEALGPG
jgi:Polyketide cyclase / dehydrase and lipid transport